MNNIILIDHEPLTKRRKQLFYLDDFSHDGFNIQVWDISQILHPGIIITDEIYDTRVYKITSLQDLEAQIKQVDINNTFFIVEVFCNWASRKIFHVISKHKCYRVKIDLYANTNLQKSFSQKVRDRIKLIFCAKASLEKMSHVAFILYKKIHHITLYNRIFSSSSIAPHTDLINHPDYENFCRIISQPSILNINQYIVFIDTYFPVHPDLIYFRHENPSMDEITKYRASLNNFFNIIEAKYKMPVVIAAHPKSNYQGSEFENRKIIKYATAELIINSQGVLLHASNAVSYIILGNKPFAIITTQGYNSYKDLYIRLKLFASQFKKKVYNIDKIHNTDIELTTISSDLRIKYINTYLTAPEIANKQNIDIIESAITNTKGQ